MAALKDITGQKFGRLTVIKRVRNAKNGHIRYLCICECGCKIVTQGDSLCSGKTASCGCLQVEASRLVNTKHGHIKSIDGKRVYSATYKSWQNMKDRCLNPKTPCYERYGGRGIHIYNPWCEDFRNFLRDMGERPLGTEIHRVDNNRGYEPGNAIWLNGAEHASLHRKIHTRRATA